jgi:hypothetical protein
MQVIMDVNRANGSKEYGFNWFFSNLQWFSMFSMFFYFSFIFLFFCVLSNRSYCLGIDWWREGGGQKSKFKIWFIIFVLAPLQLPAPPSMWMQRSSLCIMNPEQQSQWESTSWTEKSKKKYCTQSSVNFWKYISN